MMDDKTRAALNAIGDALSELGYDLGSGLVTTAVASNNVGARRLVATAQSAISEATKPQDPPSSDDMQQAAC